MSPELELRPPEDQVRNVTSDADLGRPVRIIWLDSGLSYDVGWFKLTDAPGRISECETVGLWMGENDDVVMIGQSRDADNNNWHSAQLIWKKSLVRKEWLS